MKPFISVFNVGLLVAFVPLAISFTTGSASRKQTFKTQIITADSVQYTAVDSVRVDNANNTIKLYGKACLTYKAITVKANYIEYNKVDKTGKAEGNVEIHDINNNVTGTSDAGVFDLKHN